MTWAVTGNTDSPPFAHTRRCVHQQCNKINQYRSFEWRRHKCERQNNIFRKQGLSSEWKKKKRIKTWTNAFHVPCGGKIRKKKHKTRSLNWFYLPLFAEQTQWELVNAGFLLLLLSLSLTILTTFKKWYKIGIIGVFRSFQHTGTDRPYGCTDDQAMYKVTSMCKQNAKKANRTRVNVMCFLLFLLLCVFLPRAPVIVYLLL